MDLPKIYAQICEDTDPIRATVRGAESMLMFAGQDKTFIFGDWKAWRSACQRECRFVPPEEFKARAKEQRMAYLNTPNVQAKRTP